MMNEKKIEKMRMRKERKAKREWRLQKV